MVYKHKNKELLNRLERINIAEYVRTFLLELAELEKKLSININKLSEASRIKGLMSIPKNTTFKSIADMRSGIPYWDKQKVDYIASNLGKGYIFYFVCNGCGRKAKYLYEYNITLSPLCRMCCRITYRRERRRQYGR